jgi:class 3 adenylate cyclase
MTDSIETRKLSAVLFSDIHGYSRLMQSDESATLKLLEEHNKLLFPIIESKNGKVIKTIGDAILAVFDSCTMAMLAAIEMQESIKARAAQILESQTFRIRIGIHLGEIIFKEEDIFGNGVNIAARLQPLADPGGICISHSLYEQIQSLHDRNIIKVGAVNLKNISDPVVIYRLQVDSEAEVNPLQAIEMNPALTRAPTADSSIKQDELNPQMIYSILSATEKNGNWLRNKFIKLVNIFAEAKLVFTSTKLMVNSTELKITNIFGAIEIYVPQNYSIEMDVKAFFAESKSNAHYSPSSGSNQIRITGLVLFGTLEVIVN